jgi:hypothetical protein
MTTLKQKNYIKYLEENTFKITSIDDKNIQYTCKEGHTTELTLTSLANKKAKFKDNPIFLCSDCKDIFDREISRTELDAKSKHKIVAYHDKENVDFICNNCSSEKKSTKKCLETSEYCAFCQNNHNRKSFADLTREVKDKGMTLLTSKEEYTDNKNLLVKCCCDREWRTTLTDINRGRRCMKCRNYEERYYNK